jgi:hypothetical protein
LGAPLDPIDAWLQISAGIRQFLRGWGADLGKEGRDLKDSLLVQIQRLVLWLTPQALMMKVGPFAIILRASSPT